MSASHCLPPLRPHTSLPLALGFLTLLPLPPLAQAQVSIPSTDRTLWLQAGPDAETDGTTGRVIRWQDQSGHHYDFIGSASQGPLLQANGPGNQPFLRFDLFNSNLSTENPIPADDFLSSSAMTAFFVMNVRGEASPLNWTDNSVFPFYYSVDAPSGRMILHHGSDLDGTAVPSPFAEWRLITVVRDGTAGQVRLNGTPLSLSDLSFESPVPSGLGSLSGRIELGGVIGGSGDVNDGLDLAEILLYRSALPQASLLQVEQILLDKYNLVAVPEPSTYTLVAAGWLALVATARLRRPR